MPRQQANFIENNFSKGFITEFSGLNFPENAVTEGENFVLDKDGTIRRRYGIEIEAAGATTVTRSSDCITEYEWKAVGGDGDLTFVVIQIGSTIHFWEVHSDNLLTNHKRSFTINLLDHDLAVPDTQHCQFTSGDGKLFVTHPTCEPFYVTFNPTLGTITVTEIAVQIRDFEGLEDGLTITERPVTLDDDHEYNLNNQGWHDAEYDSGGAGVGPAIETFFNAHGFYPSNADIFWYFKDAAGEFSILGIVHNYIGNTPAPKGHFILDAFNTDREGATAPAVGPITEDTSGIQRPKTCAFFAGRLFLAGVDAEGYITNIYFTQIIERDSQIGKCYQENDPTSEEQSDLLPTDGGTIKIQDAGQVVKLIPYGDKLLVMASNGIWAIGGSEGIGFKATDFSVIKISGVGLLTANSVVNADGTPFFWNNDGIWTITPSEVGDLKVQSLTDRTIQSFYKTIPPSSKKFTKGAYDSVGKIIQWIYLSEAETAIEDRQNYDSVLVFDIQLGAFYTWSIDNTVRTINAILCPSNFVTASVSEDPFRYFTTTLSGGTVYNYGFARENKTTYVDWLVAPMETYFITGYKVHGEAIKKFQSNYIIVYSNTLTNASCFLQGIWDYFTRDAGRYSMAQECCANRSDRSLQSKKLKIRGQGMSLQYKFISSAGLPFHLVGWSSAESVNAGV